MKTKNNKRILAWVLSICMAIALLPALPAECAQAADGDLVYVFNDQSYLSSEYIVSQDAASGVAETSYAYIAKPATDATANSVTNLTDFAKTLTYENTGKKGAPWELASAFAARMTYNSAHVETYGDGFYASPTWARFYQGYRGLTLHVYSCKRKAQVGIKLKVEKGQEGWYDIVPSYFYNIRAMTDAGITFTLYEGDSEVSESILKSEKMTDISSKWQEPRLGTAYFKPGEYLLMIQFDTLTATDEGKTNTISVRNLTLKPVVHETFGTSYAYIREDKVDGETQYKLILIAAVDSLNYTKVGFNYTIGDDTTVKSTEETAAYKTLTFNGASLTADDLGGSADGYLFYSEIDLTATQAASGVEFKAYADEEVGGTYSIDTAYYTAQ